MGQRLNLEIRKGDKVLANSYYHWSAYTGSSFDLVREVVRAIKNNRIKKDDEIIYAIRLLEQTGAGLTNEERKLLKSNEKYKKRRFKKCMGRNEGLIAVSEEGIKETRDWMEEEAVIDLDSEKVMFDVWARYEEEELEEYYPNIEIHPEECAEEPCSWKSYDEFLDMADEYRSGNWYRCGDIYYHGIE